LKKSGSQNLAKQRTKRCKSYNQLKNAKKGAKKEKTG